MRSRPRRSALFANACCASSTPCHRSLNFVVTNTSSRSIPLARMPRPTPRSLP